MYRMFHSIITGEPGGNGERHERIEKGRKPLWRSIWNARGPYEELLSFKRNDAGNEKTHVKVIRCTKDDLAYVAKQSHRKGRTHRSIFEDASTDREVKQFKQQIWQKVVGDLILTDH
jgi:hypothetical protein